MIIGMTRNQRVDKVGRFKRILAKETGISAADVPELWVARGVAFGNAVQRIDEVDGGFDITVQFDYDQYVLSFRAIVGVDLRVTRA